MVPSGFRRCGDLCFIKQFSKNDNGWPQQPLTERLSDIREKLDFWWSILQKGTVIIHIGQAWIFLLRNCTIPNHNPEITLLFQIFRLFFFYCHFSYKITWEVDYIHMYVWYIQLLSFQTLHTKKIWENKTYFH